MEHILYWLWLTGLFGVNSGNLIPLVKSLGGIEAVFMNKDFSDFGMYSSKILKKLNTKSLDWAKRTYETCNGEGIEIITYDDKRYPEALRHIYTPPVVLYAKGQIPDFNELFMIGVVGTRRATGYGINVTLEICTELAESGVTIVSGFAKGIDAEATKSAVNVGEYNIAVCASGLDVDYPKVNSKLRKEVIKNGLFLSEFPPKSQALSWHFQPRNRIIAGLCKGVLITEAPKSSGALITASKALEENRDVFVVPGRINDPNFEGINELIRNGAKPVFSVDDILSEYPYHKKLLKPRTVVKKQIEYKSVDKTGIEGEILRLLTEKDMHIDELIREVGVPVNNFNTAILMLEICGDVKRLAGNVFHREK